MGEAEIVDVCPKCEDTHFRATASDTNQTEGTPQKTYHCWQCGARFDVPETREARHTTAPQRGLAKRLHDVPPDTTVDELGDVLAEQGGGSA